jgi:hypothetical protein
VSGIELPFRDSLFTGRDVPISFFSTVLHFSLIKRPLEPQRKLLSLKSVEDTTSVLVCCLFRV